MKILNRDYDITLKEIKGNEKINSLQMANINNCELTRFIVVLDKNEFFINSEGYPEMTKTSQEEYDSFVSKIRTDMQNKKIEIIDEGYGTGEDELSWHITLCVKKEDVVAGVIEIDTCVRTRDE